MHLRDCTFWAVFGNCWCVCVNVCIYVLHWELLLLLLLFTYWLSWFILWQC